MVLTLPYFYSLAAALYINTCLVVAAVRWFHMCRPYDRNPHYYYPGAFPGRARCCFRVATGFQMPP